MGFKSELGLGGLVGTVHGLCPHKDGCMCMCEVRARSPLLSCLKHLYTHEDVVRSEKAQVHELQDG